MVGSTSNKPTLNTLSSLATHLIEGVMHREKTPRPTAAEGH
jgi:hypothetical protein